MGGRKKLLDAAEQLLYTLEENVLPMITLSDDREVVKAQIKRLRKLTLKERDRQTEKELLEAGLIEEVPNPLVKLRWKEREVQLRNRTAKIPLQTLAAWCKANDLDLTEDFGAEDLRTMLDGCVETSKGWQLGYEEWRTTEYEFTDLTMDGPEKAGGA